MSNKHLIQTLQEKITADVAGEGRAKANLLISDPGMGARATLASSVARAAQIEGLDFWDLNERGIRPASLDNSAALLSITAEQLGGDRQYFNVDLALEGLATADTPVLLVDLKEGTIEDQGAALKLLMEESYEGVDLSRVSVFATQTKAGADNLPEEILENLCVFTNEAIQSTNAWVASRREEKLTVDRPTPPKVGR